MTNESGQAMAASIAPWLSVADGDAAVGFYRAAFGAAELERLEEAGRVVVARLAIGGADFWVQEDPEGDPHVLGDRSPVRMILTVDDPDGVFGRAVAAGARQVAPATRTTAGGSAASPTRPATTGRSAAAWRASRTRCRA